MALGQVGGGVARAGGLSADFGTHPDPGFAPHVVCVLQPFGGHSLPVAVPL
jgi:hypothetical protein